MEKKKEEKEGEISKVKAYNVKIKNIIKVDNIANKEDNGNSSKAINRIIEAY